MGFCIVYMVWMVISSSIHIASSIRGGQYDDPVLVHLLNIIYTRRGIHLISQTHIFHIDSSSHFRPQIHFMNIISAHRGINLISCTHIYIHIWSNLTVLQIMSWTWDWLVIFYQKHLNPYLNHTILVKTKMRILVWKTEEGLVKNIIL